MMMMVLFLPGTCNSLAHSAVTVSMKAKPRTMLKSDHHQKKLVIVVVVLLLV
jgi:hypothetical protein